MSNRLSNLFSFCFVLFLQKSGDFVWEKAGRPLYSGYPTFKSGHPYHKWYPGFHGVSEGVGANKDCMLIHFAAKSEGDVEDNWWKDVRYYISDS